MSAENFIYVISETLSEAEARESLSSLGLDQWEVIANDKGLACARRSLGENGRPISEIAPELACFPDNWQMARRKDLPAAFSV